MKIRMISSFLVAGTLAACSGNSDGGAAAKTTTPSEVSAQGRFEHGPRRPFSPEGFVQRFDKNGNGTVELSELPERMREHVGKGDTNTDGILSPDGVARREPDRLPRLSFVVSG